MKILNLTNLGKSDIKYKISKFPDGQQQVNIGVDSFKNCDANGPTQIKARLNNFLDLELIICAVASLRNLKEKEIHLYVPYFEGSRSDDDFGVDKEGFQSNHYLRDVICPIINSLGFETVTVIDAHSTVLKGIIKNLVVIDNKELVIFALKDLYSSKGNLNDNGVIISPDAGASKKIFKLVEKIGYVGEVVVCSKDRDDKGVLSRQNIPDPTDKTRDKDFILVDDICDGGRTFINIAKKAIEKGYTGRRLLIITHGIFSGGFDELKQYFDEIYCTNSYSSLPQEEGLYVKQLNVF